MTYTKTTTRVADLKAGDEFRSDDDKAGVTLYWIAEVDAWTIDGTTYCLVQRFPSGMSGDDIAWADPYRELTVWRPEA